MHTVILRFLLILFFTTGTAAWADEFRAGCWGNGVYIEHIQPTFTFDGERVIANLYNRGETEVTVIGLNMQRWHMRFKKYDKMQFLLPKNASDERVLRFVKKMWNNGGFIDSLYLSSKAYLDKDISKTQLNSSEDIAIVQPVNMIAHSFEKVSELLQDENVTVEFLLTFSLAKNRVSSIDNEEVAYQCYSDWLPTLPKIQ